MCRALREVLLDQHGLQREGQHLGRAGWGKRLAKLLGVSIWTLAAQSETAMARHGGLQAQRVESKPLLSLRSHSRFDAWITMLEKFGE